MLNAAFFDTIADPAMLPHESLAEVAFAGRSNAGKSSAINTIAHHNRLAFVSKTPGRTQHLNFFRVGEQRFLVDLPGYGYARAPLAQQYKWQGLIGGYLERRAQLRGMVLIMDIRHPFTDLDTNFLTWFREAEKPVHILLSKADKLSRSASLDSLRLARERLSSLRVTGGVQLFSSLKRLGVDEAEGVLRTWLDLPALAAKPASTGRADASPRATTSTTQRTKKKPGSRG